MFNNIQYPIKIDIDPSNIAAASEIFPDYEIYNCKNINSKVEKEANDFNLILLPKNQLKNEKLVEFENKLLKVPFNFKLRLPSDTNFKICNEIIKNMFQDLTKKNFKFVSKGRKIPKDRTVDQITSKVVIVPDNEPIEKTITFLNENLKYEIKYDVADDPTIFDAFKEASEKDLLTKLPITFIFGDEILDSKMKLSEIKGNEIEFYMNTFKIQKLPEPQKFEELLTELNFIFDSFQGDLLYMLEFPLKIEKNATPTKILELIRQKFDLNQKLKFVLRYESEDITRKIMDYQNQLIHISFTNLKFRYKYNTSSTPENVEVPCNYTFRGFLDFYQIDPNSVIKIKYNGQDVDKDQLICDVIEEQTSLITIYMKSVTFVSENDESYIIRCDNDNILRDCVEKLAKQLNVSYYSIVIKDESSLVKLTDLNLDKNIKFSINKDDYNKFTESLENAKGSKQFGELLDMGFDKELSAVVLTVFSDSQSASNYIIAHNKKDEIEQLKNILRLLNEAFENIRIFTNPEDYVGKVFKPEVLISSHKKIVDFFLNKS